ncbi:MAG: T9SS type A sorting domain-containing protein [bacterium]
MKRTREFFLFSLVLLLLPGLSNGDVPERNHDYDVTELTLRHQDTIHLDSTLYREIDAVLTLACSVDDTLAAIHAFPKRYTYSVTVKVNPDDFRDTWYAGETMTGYPYLDSLSMEYGISGVRTIPHDDWPWVDLLFSQPARMDRLAELYKNGPHVIYSEASGYGGDGSDIMLKIRSDGYYFAFINAWGDCPSGCISRYWWFVQVDGNSAELMHQGESNLLDQFPYWNMVRFPGSYEFARYANVPDLLDSIKYSNRWWVKEHAMQTGVGLLQDINVSEQWEYDLYTARQTMLFHFTYFLDACQGVIDGNDEYLRDVARNAYRAALPPYPFDYPGIDPVMDLRTTDGNTVLSWDRSYPFFYDDSCHYEVTLAGVDQTYSTDATSIKVQTLYDALGLLKGVNYTWWVVAAHDLDSNRRVNSWDSEIIYYDPIPPKAFGLVSPVDKDTLDGNEVHAFRFVWNDAKGGPTAGLVDYQVELTREDTGQKDYLGMNGGDTTRSVQASGISFIYGNGSPVTVHWRVKATSADQSRYSSKDFTFTYIWPDYMLDAPASRLSSLPDRYEIASTYPNPFNPTLTAVIALPEKAHLKLEVFNLLGQRVALLLDGVQEAGWRHFVFDGTNLASGVYLLRATVPGKLEQTRRVTLVR